MAVSVFTYSANYSAFRILLYLLIRVLSRCSFPFVFFSFLFHFFKLRCVFPRFLQLSSLAYRVFIEAKFDQQRLHLSVVISLQLYDAVFVSTTTGKLIFKRLGDFLYINAAVEPTHKGNYLPVSLLVIRYLYLLWTFFDLFTYPGFVW